MPWKKLSMAGKVWFFFITLTFCIVPPKLINNKKKVHFLPVIWVLPYREGTKSNKSDDTPVALAWKRIKVYFLCMSSSVGLCNISISSAEVCNREKPELLRTLRCELGTCCLGLKSGMFCSVNVFRGLAESSPQVSQHHLCVCNKPI